MILTIKPGTQEFRVLRPWEFEAMLDSIPRVSLDQATNLKVCLLTGMRFKELRQLQVHPGWFDDEFVVVPPAKFRTIKRWVRLNNRAIDLIPHFFKSRRLPTPQAWGQNLRRWAEKAGVDPSYISAKTTRKTMESWLLAYFPHLTQHILLSQGHSNFTSLKHYSQIGFKKKDMEEMSKWVEGW